MAEHNLQNEIVGEGDEVFAIVQRPREHWIVYNDVAALFNKHFNGTPFNWTCVPFCGRFVRVSGYQFCRSLSFTTGLFHLRFSSAKDEAAEAEEVGEDPVVEEDLEVAEGREVQKRGSEKWGPQLDQATYKNRQHLYLSEQTDGSVPNTLVIANCEVVKPRVAAAEHLSQFNEKARSPFVKKYKTSSFTLERLTESGNSRKTVRSFLLTPIALMFSFGLSIYTRMRRPLGLLSVFLMTVRTGGGGTLQWSLAEANLVSKCNKL
ncbi:hypothetical protein F2Q69_00052143 [Brassica cretica]|uniref:Uncharacterized protein n=1 Tax=Brassica cretica TaxID=69181 RepID=A0A8S9MZV8_BRACR|nr:hypothetical protein F2Q69_00052143 [Brassica cretica]